MYPTQSGAVRRCLAGTALALVLLQAQAATAQDNSAPVNDSGANDIIVTAQKRAERISDVPAAILATSGDELAERGFTTKDQLMAVVPDLRVTSVTGGLGQNLSIRGIGPANNYNLNVLVPVGQYQDEVYQTFTTYPGTQMFDLNRIEVLKGPQGTLYGRNTTGGAINFVSNQPGLKAGEMNGDLSVGYGNYDRFEIRGASDLTLIDDVLGIRFAFLHTQRDGYTKNVGTSGPDTFGSDNSTAARLLVALKPSPDFSATLGLYYNDFDGSIPVNIPYGAAPNNNVGGYYSRPSSFSPYESEVSFFVPHRAENYYGGLTLNWELGAVTLTSITSYGKANGRVTNDCDSTPVNVCSSLILPKSRQASQDLRMLYEGDGFKLTAGANYGWDRYAQTFNVDFGGATFLSNRFVQTRDTYGVFADATVNLTDRFEVTGGLRYTKDIGVVSGVQTDVLVGAIDGPPSGVSTIPLQPDFKRKSDGITGRLILTYELPDDLMFYASYSKGYRGGAFNGVEFFDPRELNYVEPERTQNFEAGIKGSPAPGVQFAFDVYYMKIRNQQVQSLTNIPACPTCNPPTQAAAYASLAGLEGRNYGAEFDLSYRISSALRFNLSGTYLNTRYSSGPDQVVAGVSVAGNRFPFAPKFGLRSGLDWTAIDNGDTTLTLSGNVNYTGRYWFDPANGANTAPGFFVMREGQKPYTTVDARAVLEVGRFQLGLWASNLFDKFYLSGGTNTESSFGSDQMMVGAPRTFGATVGVKF